MTSRRNSYTSATDSNDDESDQSDGLFPQITHFSHAISHTQRKLDAASNKLNQRKHSSVPTSDPYMSNFLPRTNQNQQQHISTNQSMFYKTSPIDCNDDVDRHSISTQQMQECLTNLPRQAWDNKTHEKFFYTKMFNMLPTKSEQDLSDFTAYDNMIRKEAELEEKATKIMNEQQNSYMKVGTTGLADLEARFKAGDEDLQVLKDKGHKHRFKKSTFTEGLGNHHQGLKLTEILKKPFSNQKKKTGTLNEHDNDINMNKENKQQQQKQQNNKRNELYNLMSNNTEIIDISQNYLAKNLFKLDQDQVESNSEMTRANLEKIESSEFTNNKAKYHLQRKLEKHQIQMIALGGTLGVGLFLSSGKAFSIGGPLGCLLGFMISGSIVLATMLSFAEMSTLIPTTSSISGLASRFVEDAFGFALGWSYWLSFTIAMPGEVCAAVIMLSYFEELGIPGLSSIGFVTLFLFFIISVNLLDVRIYGNIEFLCSFFKVMITVVLIFTMLAVNVKEKYGFKYWRPSMSGPWETFGPFRPTFDLKDIGDGARNGIGGSTGRFLQILSSSLISSYAFSGSEIGFIAAMECKNPRKALPSVTKRVFGRIMILYFLSIFMVGLNMYAGDPRLLRYYAPRDNSSTVRTDELIPTELLYSLSQKCPVKLVTDYPNGNQSPWIIALQTAGYCTFGSVLNAMLIIFATSAGSSHLYTSSRTLYSMAIQAKAPSIFARCSHRGVPYYSVLFCGVFGFLAFASVSSNAMIAFQDFSSLSSTTTMLMWAGMCISFLRFYYGLNYRPDIIARDDPSYPYRSPFQPFLAIYGLVGSMIIALSMGFVVFIPGYWSVKTFFVSYGGILIFVICYLGYKFSSRSSRIQRLDQLDLDSGRREMDRMIWDEEKDFKAGLGLVDILKRILGWLT